MWQQKKPRCNPESDNPKEVLIDPPNMRTNPVKRGQSLDKVLFMAPSYNALDDQYKSAVLKITRREHRDLQIQAGNEKPFRPQSRFKIPVKAAYEHMQDRNHIQKNFRNEEKEVMIAPRNIQTMPMKRGRLGRNVHFGGMVPYIEDEFDRPKEFAAIAREKSLSMMQDKPFS